MLSYLISENTFTVDMIDEYIYLVLASPHANITKVLLIAFLAHSYHVGTLAEYNVSLIIK